MKNYAGPYDRYQTLPVEDIEKADAILSAVDHHDLTVTTKVAFAHALIALAKAKMMGAQRR